MTSKLLSFDLEIMNDFEAVDGKHDRLGISCAAALLEDDPTPIFWHAENGLDRDGVSEMVRQLEAYTRDGYTIVTWNGAAFDFRVVAASAYPDELSRIASLCKAHWDIMLQFVITKGYRLGLDACAKGCGVQVKKSLDGGHGENVPRLWREGRFKEVLTYLGGDVETTMQVARYIRANHGFSWVSKSGKGMSATLTVPRLVSECMKINVPVQSWITDPPKMNDMVGWMKTKEADQMSLFQVMEG